MGARSVVFWTSSFQWLRFWLSCMGCKDQGFTAAGVQPVLSWDIRAFGMYGCKVPVLGLCSSSADPFTLTTFSWSRQCQRYSYHRTQEQNFACAVHADSKFLNVFTTLKLGLAQLVFLHISWAHGAAWLFLAHLLETGCCMVEQVWVSTSPLPQRPTQRLQYALIKEYSMNHIGDPSIIEGIFPKYKEYSLNLFRDPSII